MAISVVQGASAFSSSKAFASNNTSGNLIIACAVLSVSGGTVTFSDTAGNSYRNPATGSVGAASQVPYQVNASSIVCAYAENVAAGANTVSFSSSNGTGGFSAINIIEIFGIATSSSLDQFVSNANASSTAGGVDNKTSTAKTTTVNGELIFGYEAGSAGTDTAGTGFTMTPNNIGASETQVQSTAGSIAATVNASATGDAYAMLMMTFVPASGGGFTAKFRKTLSPMGTKVGSRQLHDYSH